MARFRRWYRRRYGRRSYNRFRRYRRRFRRFVNGSSRSRVRVKIPATISSSVQIPASRDYSYVIGVNPFFSNTRQNTQASTKNAFICGCVGTPLYNAYRGLYDAVKCDGMKIQLSITSAVGSGADAYRSLAVSTAIDRKTEKSDFQTTYQAQSNTGWPTVPVMKESSSYLCSTALNNSITKITRSCYASDLFEKNGFADASTETRTDSINGVANQSYLQLVGANPNFTPTMFIGFDTGGVVDSSNNREVFFTLEVMYYMTFRNPKFGAGANQSRIEGLPATGLDEDRRGPGGGDFAMDDGDIDDGRDLDDGADIDFVPAATAAAQGVVVDRNSQRYAARRGTANDRDPVLNRRPN